MSSFSLSSIALKFSESAINRNDEDIQYSSLEEYDWENPRTKDNPKGVSGIWKPIRITNLDPGPIYCEPLTFSKSDKSSSFNPCNCSLGSFTEETEGFYDNVELSTVNCSYCSPSVPPISWYLYDNGGNPSPELSASDCCDGMCDTRLNKDDYLPKIPMLNQGMLTGFVDFKYMNEFPGCSNPGLGQERYYKYDRDKLNAETRLTLTNCDMYIDWKMKECMSEIPYDALDSQYSSQYLHEKAYRRAQSTSRTAGNFILIDKVSFLTLPDVEDFKAPYGFNNSTYNNVFIKGKKIASYWKWNYTSGVKCWQRYFKGNTETYISPGDFFYATLDGPEPVNPIIEEEEEEETEIPDPYDPDPNPPDPDEEDRKISLCGSGLKVINSNGDVSHIIPSGTEFIYISENIYPLFKSIFERVTKALSNTTTLRTAIDIAATLATGPQYDNITTDLLSPEDRGLPKNEFLQIKQLNEDMNSGTYYGSAFDFAYCKTTDEEINNLRHKYGQYIWVPPRTTATIEIEDAGNGLVEFDFDMVLDKRKIKHGTTRHFVNPPSDIPLSDKCFAYKLTGVDFICNPFGETRSVRTCSIETGVGFDGKNYREAKFDISKSISLATLSCNGGTRYTPVSNTGFYDKYPRIVLNEDNITAYCQECDPKSSYYIPDSGRTLCKQENFCDYTLADYFRGTRVGKAISDNSLVMHRTYYAQARNARIDAVATHPNNGSAIESEMFGLNKSKAIFRIDNDNPGRTSAGGTKIYFTTYDAGIKIYDLRYEPLQHNNNTMHFKRFPIDYDNLCSCEPIVPPQYSEYNYLPSMTPNALIGSTQGYTPNVSVGQFSPNLKKYGGYNQEYLDDNFPGERLAPDILLEDLEYRIDPEYPFGRSSQSKSVTLPNYHTTEWQFFTSANKVSVSENADLYGHSYRFFENEYNEDDEEMNKNWKRFTTKVDLNHYGGSVRLYNQQSAYITPGMIDLKLVNPFLSTLTNGELVLHPPTVTGGNYFFDNIWGLFGPRGDEMSSVTLNFSNDQGKHLLYFDASHMSSRQLDLEPVEFTIDNGLKFGTSNTSHINKSGLIFFEDLEKSTDTLCFQGNINSNFINSLNEIYKVGKEKSPKVIIEYGGTLYEYKDYNIDPFSYNIPSQDKVFSSPSILYEYIYSVHYSAKIPYVAPIYKKTQPLFLARYNSITNNFRGVDTTEKPFGVPVKKNKIYSANQSIITLPGDRHYYCVKVSQDIIETNTEFTDVENLGNGFANTIKSRSLVDFNDQLFMYIGGDYSPDDRRKPSNYFFLPDLESARLFTNYCNLSFDLTDVGIRPSVPNSLENAKSHSVKLYTKAGRVFRRSVGTRELILKSYLPNQKETRRRDTTNFRLFTKLTLLGTMPQNQEYLIDSINSDFNTSLVFYLNADFSEHIDKDMLYPNIMYSDLENFDGNMFNQPIVNSNISINDLPIPKSAYNNAFYKLILSDLQPSISFTFRPIIPILDEDNKPTGEIELGEEFEIKNIKNIQYNIVQKYAMDDINLHETYYLKDIEKYQNYLGILDVNIFDKSFPGPRTPYAEFFVKSNRLWQNTIDEAASPNMYLLNLNKYATLEPIGSTQSLTMSARSTPFILKKVDRTGKINRLAPSRPLNDLYSRSSNLNVTQKRKYPFIKYDIYAFPAGCHGEFVDRDCDAFLESSIELRSIISFASGNTAGSIYASQLEGQNIKVGFSYDDGLGANLTSSNFYTKIKRAFDVDSSDICNSRSNQLLPQLIYDQQQDPAYWNNISDTNYNIDDSDQETSLIAKTDEYANEMLFRILYGQKQIHNRERLFFEDEAITYAKLADGSYEIEAKDLFKEIPYNYDRTADMPNFYVNHTINVYGTGGNGEIVEIDIGNTNLRFSFVASVVGESVTHKANVSIQGEANSSYVVNLNTGGSASKYDYILYTPPDPSDEDEVENDLGPPEGVKVGTIKGRKDYSYGWRAIRFYTGDPRLVGSCSQVGPSTAVLADCPVNTLIGPDDQFDNATHYEIDNGGCGCTMNLVPTMETIDNPGIPYECEDGTEYGGQNHSCAKYGYGSSAGGEGEGESCDELKEWAEGGVRQYHFENCRTAWDLTASVGSSSFMNKPDDYEPPSTEYKAVGGCGGGSCRGYILSLYARCGEQVPVSKTAQALASECDREIIYPDEPEDSSLAEGCTTSRDPGYDMCAFVISSNDRGIMEGDVYQITIPGVGSEYKLPLCPTQLLSITYTTDSITVTVGSDTRCFSIPYRRECKITKVRLPNKDYYITESMESECDSDRNTPNLDLFYGGRQSFLTVDTTLNYYIGSYTAGDVNEASPIMWGRGALDACERGSSGYSGAWTGVGLCGVESEGPWIGPRGVEDFKGLAFAAIVEFLGRVGSLGSTFNLTGTDQVVNQNAEQARWAKDPHYTPNTHVLRGPIGGGGIFYSVKEEELPKVNIEGTSTFTQTTVTAYASVPYRIPLSTRAAIQQTVGSALCSNDYDTNIRHPFPDWYGDLTGARKFDEVTQEYDSPRVRSANFAIINSDFRLDCNGLQSNYNDSVLKDEITISPCAIEDYACWIKQGWTETIGREWR